MISDKISGIEGVFIKELQNRFLCEVLVAGKIETCYIPSSCHLSHFLKLDGRSVILRENVSKGATTPYALAAIPYKRSHVVLNTAAANRAFENSLTSRRFSFLGPRKQFQRECMIEQYKCDFFIPHTRTIIEVKSVLTLDHHAVFPTIYSERFLRQLNCISVLLEKGYSANLIIVGLNPYIKDVRILKESYCYNNLIDCFNKGLSIKAYTLRTQHNDYTIDKQIKLFLD